MDFEITTNLDTLRNQQITANFEAVDAWLTEELKPYASMAVTADMIPTAKTYRANLRKVKDRIESYRKEAKTAALAPYYAFEEKAKVLTGKIDTAVESLDEQVKEFERRESDAKIAAIKAVYDADEHTEAKEYCPWESILNPRWSNKTYSLVDAKEEVIAALFYAANDLDSIRQMGGDNTAYLLDVYKSTRDLNAVIRRSLEIQAAKEREEQRKRDEMERQEALKRAQEAKKEQTVIETSAPAEHDIDDIVDAEPIYTVSFRVRCNRTQLIELGNYMKSKGIVYRKC